MRNFIFVLLLTIQLVITGCVTDKIFSKKNPNELKPEQKIYGEINNNSIIFVTGKGIVENPDDNSAKSYILAERAAIIDGYRLLAEKIAGIMLDAYSAGEDFNISKDQIMVRARSYVRGADVVNIRHLKNGVVEADMQIRLSQNLISSK